MRLWIFILVLFASDFELGLGQDADLRDLDVSAWPCLNRLEGTAKTPDAQARNRMKNRTAVDLSNVKVEQLDTAGFSKKVAAYDAQLKANRRSQLTPEKQKQLTEFEDQIVSLTGYLLLSYPGPAETTNCGDRDFHDWHLEVFEKSSDHHPQPGDQQTPIICEITPRIEQAIYGSGIRLRQLSGFTRLGKQYASTQHAAQLVRVTGYLLWDDEHNGKADVGKTIDYISEGNGFHHPWRSTAWEVHPVLKIESVSADAGVLQTESAASKNAAVSTAPTAPIVSYVTLVRPVEIIIPYGKTRLPIGMRLEVVSRSSTSVLVRYLGGSYAIPISATDHN